MIEKRSNDVLCQPYYDEQQERDTDYVMKIMADSRKSLSILVLEFDFFIRIFN